MREKLIELLDDIQMRGETYTDYEIYGMRLPNTISNEEVADHLISNGVTITVRCKECKKQEICRATNIWAVAPGDEWFCADGERKDNG